MLWRSQIPAAYSALHGQMTERRSLALVAMDTLYLGMSLNGRSFLAIYYFLSVHVIVPVEMPKLREVRTSNLMI